MGNSPVVYNSPEETIPCEPEHRVRVPLLNGSFVYLSEIELSARLHAPPRDFFIRLLSEFKDALPHHGALFEKCIGVVLTPLGHPLSQDAYTYSTRLRDLIEERPGFADELIRIAAFLDKLVVAVINEEWTELITKHRTNVPRLVLRPTEELTPAQIVLQDQLESFRWGDR